MATFKREKTAHKVGFSSPFHPDLTQQESQLFRELQEESTRMDTAIEAIDIDIEEYDDSEILQAIGDLRRSVLRYTQNYERLGFRP